MTHTSDSEYDYMANGWTRHEAFADILRKHPPREEYRDGDIVVLSVSFGYNGNTYCYRCRDNVYKPGDLIKVTVRGEIKVVEVVSVGYYSEDEYPFTQVPLNTIIGPAEGSLADKYREVIEAERNRELRDDGMRAEAKRLLEEAFRLKSDSTAELDRAREERRKAKDMMAQAEKNKVEASEQVDKAKELMAEAEKHKDEARTQTEIAKELMTQAERDKEEARRQTEKARQLMAEAEAAAAEAREAAEETAAAGERARLESEHLEAARKEAAKVWKRSRPETDNQIILDLREIQDALDEDEEIYRAMSDLEDKMTKVMRRADKMIEDSEDGGTEIQRLYDFYLPKTITVLGQYRNLFSSGLPQKDVARLRADVLDDIRTSTEVYDNLLHDLMQSDMLDLYAEMKALQLMFGINGLLSSDFEIEE